MLRRIFHRHFTLLKEHYYYDWWSNVVSSPIISLTTLSPLYHLQMHHEGKCCFYHGTTNPCKSLHLVMDNIFNFEGPMKHYVKIFQTCGNCYSPSVGEHGGWANTFNFIFHEVQIAKWTSWTFPHGGQHVFSNILPWTLCMMRFWKVAKDENKKTKVFRLVGIYLISQFSCYEVLGAKLKNDDMKKLSSWSIVNNYILIPHHQSLLFWICVCFH